MSTDAILDFTAAAVVFGSVLAIAYRDVIWGKIRKIFHRRDVPPKPPGMLYE